MKKIVIILTLCALKTFAQPTSEAIDIHSGCSIKFHKIQFEGNEMYYNFSSNILYYSDRPNENYGIWILEKSKKEENNNNSLLFPYSKIENINKIFYALHIIYQNEMMTIKVKNLIAGVRFRFEFLNFKKGSYEIDMKFLYESKEDIFYNDNGEIIGNRKKSDWQNIYLKRFPFN